MKDYQDKGVVPFMASLGIFGSSRCRAAFTFRAGCALAALLFCGKLSAQPTNLAREDFWVPDGQVNAIVETNGVLYIGGLFDYISPVSDTGNAFDLTSGAALPGFPKVNGAVKAILTDNAGGWFIGGLFTSV